MMFLVARDGSEDLYVSADTYEVEGDDLVFYNVEEVEVGRVFGGAEAGNAVVAVEDVADDEADEE